MGEIFELNAFTLPLKWELERVLVGPLAISMEVHPYLTVIQDIEKIQFTHALPLTPVTCYLASPL